jgi:Eukaryotic aspartyl protease
LFDTGSCEFWVPSETCSRFTQPVDRCSKHARYDITKSSSNAAARFASTPNQRMLIQYLSGKVEGDLITEEVRVGDLVVADQQFGAAETIDVPLLDSVHWDGIVGLAYPSSALARTGVTPFFDNVIAKKLLPSSVFGYYLGPRSGMVTFGAVDLKYIAPGAEFVYAAVTHKSYWTVGVVDVILTYPDGSRVATGVCKSRVHGRCRAIIDTGTYLVYGPQEQVSLLFSFIKKIYQ